MVISILWTPWLGRNSRNFEEKELDSDDFFERAKLSASLWASTDKVFKCFPFLLIILNWKDVIGN